MRMFPPTRRQSIRRSSTSQTHRPVRFAALIALIAIAGTALATTNSSASSLGRLLFAKATSIVAGGATPVATKAMHTDHTVEAEFAADSATMATARRGHTATRLADGRVLIAGGENADGVLNEVEIYDPSASTFGAAGNMNDSRADHTATLLADGRVLIAGGRNGAGALASTEIFDPATGAFTSGPSMSVARAGHSATRLGDGRVLVAGGDASGTAEILNSSLSGFTGAGSLTTARSKHSAALLQDGRVLLVGGKDGANELSSGEIFDTSSGAFSTIDSTLRVARVRPHLRVLFDGKVQIIGGSNDGSMEIYDPVYEGFGAYAHVVPESDPCVGLSGQVLASQTRAALFHIGQTDALLDRSGHTITEMGGQALVLGGANSSGAVLSSSSVVASSGASITTDKMDYAPGETAHISGRGFQPGETVRLKIHEDPHTPQERGLDVVADGQGSFVGDYLVQVYDIDMKFLVGARGLTSGATAQTTFTDANPQNITVAAPTSVTVIQGATANYGNLTLIVGGNTNPCTVTFAVSPALPAGAAAVFGTNPVSTTGANVVTSFSVTTSASTPTGTYTFQVTGSNSGGCQGPGPTASNTLTLIVNSAAVNTTTAVANATATYGDASVTLSATVTPASGPAVNSGSVTFTVKQGPATIGVAATDTTIVAGAASVNYLLPAGTAAGSYTIEASYSGATGFNSSSGSGSLTINQKNLTVSASNKTKVYGDTVTFDESTPSTDFSVSGLVNADTVDSVTLTSAGAAATATVAGSPYAIIPSAAVGTGLLNYNISYVNGSLTVDPRPLTITANNKTKVYGDVATFDQTTPSTDFSVSGLVNSDTVDSVTLTSAGAAATATVAGSPYAIIPSAAVGTGLSNYNISYVNGSLTVDPRPLTITASNRTKVYGDTVMFDESTPSTDFSVSGLVNSDTVDSITITSSGAAATATVAGSPYAIIPTAAVGTGLSNYNISYVNGSLTVDPRPLTITASNRTKTYGDTVTFDESTPSTDFSVSGLVNADSVDSVTLTSAGAGATATVSGSPYDIIPSAAVGTGLDNYNISYVNGSLTVDPRPLTITASNRTKVYGDTVVFDQTTPSADFSVSALVNSDTVDSVTLTSAGAAAGAPVAGSPYSIVPSAAAGTGVANYNITYVNGALTVDKAPLTITASSHTVTFADAVPTITPTYTGFVAGDDPTDLTTQPTCSTTYTVGSLVGTYPTKCENAVSSNYNITYVNGTVTVLTACSAFNGFLAPIGGAVENMTGGSFADPVRSFKLNSTIPVKFSAICFGAPLTTGVHTLQAIKYSNSTTSDAPIDATPTDAATTGNQFRLTDGQWHFNLSTKGLAGSGQGIWLLKATLFDGSTYTVWVEIKK